MEVFLNRESVAKIRPMEPTRDPSLVRLMLLRGALIGGALAALFVLVFHEAALGAVVAGLILGALFSATAFIEERARRASFRGRALAGALASGSFAFVCGVLAMFQVPYTVVAITTGSQKEALSALQQVYDKLSGDVLVYVALSLMLSPMFALGTWVRVRGSSARGRVLAALATPLLSAPPFAVIFFPHPRGDEVAIGIALAGCLVAVPILLELADWLERRLAGPET